MGASDGSMALAIPMFATIPTSLVLLLILPGTGTTFLLSIILGALADALVVSWCARTLRGGGKPDTSS